MKYKPYSIFPIIFLTDNMLELLSTSRFNANKRELLLDYAAYADEAGDLIPRIPKAAKKLSDREWVSTKDAATLLRLTDGRTHYALDLLTLSYSAGSDVSSLRDFYPTVLAFFEEYGLYSEAYNATQSGTQALAPHLFIQDVEFERANRLLCFAILLGYPDLVPRVMALIDYNNPIRDGMLERLASFYTHRPHPIPTECTRHLPYYKTLAIFDALPAHRPTLMQEYLQDWYEASRREPYYNAHARNNQFLGYWSWEAAAITIALGIDDRTYRNLEFYPRDLADFWNANQTQFKTETGSRPKEVRAKAGESCPVSGRWESIGVPSESATYNIGDTMRDLGSPYGLTVWRLKNAD
ncbi:PoNe immunity protein domain-containing protein [Massilia sp. DD77]|uniref:PoNe immunity protein domain-containing protein n=1 Tax=Massilia sp. DD77 TaxID=3109349 RepID=UPI002FFFE077